MTAAAVVLAAGAAWGQVTVTCTQVATDVVCTSPAGSLDLTGLPPKIPSFNDGFMVPSSAVFVTSPTPFSGIDSDAYAATSVSGPTSFGPGGQTYGSFGSGPGILGPSPNYIYVPKDYVSGAPIAPTSMTFAGATAASLGVTPGVYEWTWGSGLPAQKFTLRLFAATAEDRIMCAADIVDGLGPGQVSSPGNQIAFLNHLSQAVSFVQRGNVAQARNKLTMAIQRTDGCEKPSGIPDATGPQSDWITSCSAQTAVLACLRAALALL